MSPANNLSEVTYTGRLVASTRAALSFEASGVVSTVNVDLGDHFSEGDILAILDDTKLRIQVKSEEAKLASARVNLKEAQIDYDRNKAVILSGAISQRDLDQAKARLDNAIAVEKTARAGVESINKNIQDLFLTAPYSG